MDIKYLQELISGTQNKKIRWETTVLPYEFMVNTYKNILTISKMDDSVSLYEWDGIQDEKKSIDFSESLSSTQLLNTLYETILKSDNKIYQTYNKYISNMNEKTKDASVSLYKLMRRLGYETNKTGPLIKLKESESFSYIDRPSLSNSKYVRPPMSQIPTAMGMTDLAEAEVVIISAPGATGKTAMTEFISNKLNIPVLNLGKHPSVGANSISGLMMHNIEADDIFAYHGGMRTGMYSMIIDGLDEGAMKVSQGGLEAFLEEISSFAKGALGLPFVILGRTAIMDDVVLVLESNDVKVTHLQIEPFTISEAHSFIDINIDEKYKRQHFQQYKELKDYIIEQIEGFFKNESDMNKKLFERFIGYAPVLQSIVTLLNANLDYHRLLEELKQNNKRKIALLVDIVKRIVERETSKIVDEVLMPLLDNNRPQTFIEDAKRRVGLSDEQCVRVLSYCLGETINIPISDDSQFNTDYNAKINEWIEGHPFIDKKSHGFHNVVFESYVVASLIDSNEHRDNVLKYLNKTKSNSYLLLDMYNVMVKEETRMIDYRFFPYLYNSFKSLDLPKDIGFTEILSVSDEPTQESLECSLSFGRDGVMDEYDFTFRMSLDDVLLLPSKLSAFTLDSPLKISTSPQKVEIQTNCIVVCDSITICSNDVLLIKTDDIPIIIDCNVFQSICDDGQIPIITNRSNDKNVLKIFTKSKVSYPFVDYREDSYRNCSNRQQMMQMYQKLRRMILMFRSHSKGVLARCCSKIDSRIGKNDFGVKLIDALLERGVMYKDNIMYYINPDKQAEVLGFKYDDIRSLNLNEKTIAFLQSINEDK